MQRFIGTKILNARPMTRGEYNELRGCKPPEGEEQSTHGYLVEYDDGGPPNHPDFKGYISWSPATVFDKSYRPLNFLTFGDALEALKAGKRVRRLGWAEQGLFVFMQVPATIQADVIPKMTSLPESVKAEFGRRGQAISYANQFALVKANNQINGWAPSSGDALAEDWEVIEVEAAPNRPAYQHRVFVERAELDDRLMKLHAFIGTNPMFGNLPPDEQQRLRIQRDVMTEYCRVLSERIAAFPQ